MSLRTFAAILAVLLAALAAPAHAQWLRAESASFIAFSESGENRVREQVTELEEFDRLLRMLTGTTTPPSPNKLTVYFVRGHAGLRRIANVGSGIAGFYTASPEGIVAVVDETRNRDENENDTLFHEYAHHFMLQYHPAAYPRWYVEGFAEYMMTARFYPNRIEFGQHNRGRVYALANRGTWLPWDRILFQDERLRPDEIDRYYAQSWLLVHFLVRDADRRARLAAYMAALGRGEDRRTAFSRAFGMSMADFGRALQRYPSEMTFSRATRAGPAAAPAVTVTRLPASAGDALLAQAALRVGVPESGAAEFLNRVRRMAARHNDDLSKRVLAHAEILHGTPASADPLLDALLARAPADAELLYLRGLRHLMAGRADRAARAAQYREAQTWFVRAHRIDENHFPSLYRFAESLTLERRYRSENTQNILLLATHLAPQVPEIRLTAARLLLLREQYETAENLLLPLAGSAHEGDAATLAREMLAMARARDASGLESAAAE